MADVFHNDTCDRCEEVKPVVIGLGPAESGPMIGFCLDCLGVKSVAEWEEKKERARQHLEDELVEAALAADGGPGPEDVKLL